MTISLLILLSLTSIVAIWITRWLIEQWKLRLALSLLPGYRGNPVLGSLHFLMGRSFGKIPFDTMLLQTLSGLSSLFRKEGLCKLWFLSEPRVLLYSAETMEPILRSNTLIEKSVIYRLLQCWLGTGLLTSTGNKWRKRRKLITPTFHYRILEDFLPIFDRHSKSLVKTLGNFRENEWIDIVPVITLFTLDIICETAMGVKLEAQDDPSEYADSIAFFTDIFSKRGMKPWLENDTIFFLTPDGRRLKRALYVLHNFTSQIVKQRKEEILNGKCKMTMPEKATKEDEYECGRKSKRAFLDMLLQVQMVDNSLSDQDICEEVDTFMFEGHDTTAMGLCWAIYYLGRHPDVQERAYQELQEIFGNEMNSEVTLQHLKDMKYLECIIKESQRLSPSVPMITRQVSEDIKIKDYTVPAGTNAILSIYNLHRDPTVFPNPELFDPDRFLPENSLGRHPFAFVPFSAGPRNCIGQKFAMNEMKVSLCNVIRNYIVEAADPVDKIMYIMSLVLRPANGIKIKFTRRPQHDF